MKNIIVLLIVIIIPWPKLFSQSLNLLNKERHWSTLVIVFQSEECCLLTNFVKFKGDTTIQTQTYTKVLESNDSLQTIWKVVGFVREEPQTGLYFRNDQGREELLYDYNLQLNDTFNIANTTYIFDTVSFIVKKIDSVLVNGALKRRIQLYNLDHPTYTDEWIEDIGSLKGILYDNDFGTGSMRKLLCCYQNEMLLYKNSNYKNCYYFTTTEIDENFVEPNQLKIYPNPSQEIITIQFTSEKTNSFSIYNSFGILIKDGICLEKESVLDISKFPAGIYFITIRNPNTNSQKFVKY